MIINTTFIIIMNQLTTIVFDKLILFIIYTIAFPSDRCYNVTHMYRKIRMKIDIWRVYYYL